MVTHPIERAQVTFSHAARAAGVTDRTLRNWLDRGQVILEGDDGRVGATWRRFSILDVVRLAIIGRLVDYGVPVAEAYEIVADTIDPGLRGLMDRPTTPRDLPELLRNMTVAVSREGGTTRKVSFGYQREDPASVAGLQHYIFIRAGEVATAALDRLES
jgi:DNA-binding transcriptional MerR regulator